MTTWTAPEVTRAATIKAADERTAVEDWLDFQRATLLAKCAGLSAEQLKQASVEPSNLTLLGLVRHMADVERWWFRRFVDGEDIDGIYPDETEWVGLDEADAAADIDQYLAECAAARATAARYDLDHVVPDRGRWKGCNVRWVYLHMIEEYARHNGHADLIRERIDGATGD